MIIEAEVSFPLRRIDNEIADACKIEHDSMTEFGVRFEDEDGQWCKVYDSDLPLLKRLMKDKVPYAKELYVQFMKHYLGGK